jgi:hypothetical protein
MPALQGKVIEALPATDLLKRHESVSEETLLRNRCGIAPGVFEQRTAHAMFQAGQLRLVTQTLINI